MDAPLRVALADDHALFREGLKALLKVQPDVTVVAETDHAYDIPRMLQGAPPDILLLDLQMERNTLADIAAFAARCAVIVVTASESATDALAALRAGARAVVWKRFASTTLLDAVHAVAAGRVWMPAGLGLLMASAQRQRAHDPISPREREVIRHVALGLRNAEVATLLAITEQTVKTHLNHVFHKLGLRDRVELAIYAARVGIIEVHETPRRGTQAVRRWRDRRTRKVHQ
jgi:DNA-binding NarL/FixJ family response regulator